MTSVVK